MSWRSGGVRNWVVQRVSAVYMAIFLLLTLAYLAGAGPLNYHDWFALAGTPVFSVLLLMFLVALLLHAWTGIRDVVLDYVSPDGLRFGVLVLFAVYLLAMAVWGVRILLVSNSLN